MNYYVAADARGVWYVNDKAAQWVASFASREHAERFAAELNHHEWTREKFGVDIWEERRKRAEHLEAFGEAMAELNAVERCPCGGGSRDDDHACGLARPERRDPTSKQRRLSERPKE